MTAQQSVVGPEIKFLVHRTYVHMVLFIVHFPEITFGIFQKSCSVFCYCYKSVQFVPD